MSEAICPACGKLASTVNHITGWRFWCESCRVGWVHPQDISHYDASAALYESKQAANVNEQQELNDGN